MKTKRVLLLALLALTTLNSALSTAHAQGTSFTYQGQLVSNGIPASGNYDMAFSLYSVSTGGFALVGPVTNIDVAITNGLFTTIINFGGDVFTGVNYWLDIAVRTNGGNTFTELTPRQQLQPVPYALYAPNAGTATSASSAASAVTAQSANEALSAAEAGLAAVADQVPATGITGTLPLAI